jgi:hypothetical protein
MRRRDGDKKRLEALTKEVDRFVEKKKGSPVDIFRRCQNAFRVPRPVLDAICDALTKLKWSIHHCQHQADTCIAAMCDQCPNTVVVSKDSDMLIFDSVVDIVIPEGKEQEWRLYHKADVLEELELNHPWQLLLLGVLTTNDYTSGVWQQGIQKNLDFVRSVVIPPSATTQERVAVIRSFVDVYLDRVAATHRSKYVGTFDNAIQVFTRNLETKSAITHSGRHS